MTETADFNVDDFEQQNQAQGDATLLVKFFYKSRPDSAASLKEGRPMFKEVEYVDIKIPGSRTGGACRPARQDDVNRFPQHYAAFKNRVAQPDSGTPLLEWGLIPRSQAEELAFFNVKTVEQLAEMADVHSSKFMGLNALRDKAKQYIQKAKDDAPAAALAGAMADKDEEIRLLKERLNALEVANPPAGTESIQLAVAPVPLAEAPEPEDAPALAGEVVPDGGVLEHNALLDSVPDPEPKAAVKPRRRKKRSRNAKQVTNG